MAGLIATLPSNQFIYIMPLSPIPSTLPTSTYQHLVLQALGEIAVGSTINYNPSILDTATFRHLVLNALQYIANNPSGGGGGTVTSITAGAGLTGGVITTSGTIAIDSSVVVKDDNNNISANAFFNNLATITASGTQVVLTAASAPVSLVTGSGGQTIKLPNATTLTKGTIFSFNNNQSSGAILVNNNSNTLVVSIPSGGYVTVVLLNNATAAGSWDRHDQSPSNVSWSTNTFDYPGSITSATWNGNTVAANRGGTGQSSAFVAGGIAYGSSTSALGVTPIGTVGQVLTSAGAGTPTWTTPTTGTVTSVTGTSPIASSGGATPAISIAAASTTVSGAVQLTDSTSSTSITTAATPNSVKSAYDLANGKAGTAQANTFSQPQIITGTSASAMLRVTQEGAGEALRVEDSPNPDSTPFVVSSVGKVGVGVAPDATVGLSVDSTGIKFSDGSIQTIASSGVILVEANTTANIVGTMVGNTFTVTATGVFTTDGYTPVLGDTVAFMSQVTTTQNGFWQVSTVGAVGVQPVFVRPTWFTGVVKNTMYITRFGTSQGGFVMALAGPLGSTDITVGTSAIIINRVSSRVANATTGTNLFTGYQTFRANGSTANQCPFTFQAGSALMSSPIANAVEWFGDVMYLTTNAGVRTTNVTNIAVPATSTSTGVAGQIAVDNANNFLYVCTATNVWKRTLLTTF